MSYNYLKDESIEENQDVYLKTVVFKDSDNDLIPITVNFHSEVELEQDVRNRIELMKSDEFLNYGLYPVLSHDLQVESVDLKDKVLTINFNDQLYANKDAMDIIETLTYTMTDYEDVDELDVYKRQPLYYFNIILSILTEQFSNVIIFEFIRRFLN